VATSGAVYALSIRSQFKRRFSGGVFVHADGASGSDRHARLFWQTGWDPWAISVEAEPVPPSHNDAFDIARFPAMVEILTDENGKELVLLADGPRQVQLEVLAGTLRAGPVRLHCHVVGFSKMSDVAQTLVRLDAFRRLGRFPKALFPPDRQVGKWIKSLRAHDGAVAGASQRDIATVVFGPDLVKDQWNGRSDFLRARVQRLLKYARRMIDGGYRQLLS